MVSSGRYAISSILLVLSTVIIAQGQVAPDKTPGATITGKVTIKGQGAPGIAVVLVKNMEGSQRNTHHRAFTDASGTYRITNVPPGNYRAATATPEFVAVDGLPTPLDKSKKLLINKDETVESIDFELMRGGVITGRVTDADGRPIIEETVSIFREESNQGHTYFEHRGTRTDDRGVYRLFGIAPGTYKIAAGTKELSPSWERSPFHQTFHPDVTDASQAKTIDVTEGSETTNVDITIKEVGRTYSIRGRIIDGDTGRPIANVPYGISVYLTPNQRSGLTDGSVSNSNGEFQWPNLRPGKYSVFVNAPSDADWRAEETPFEVNDRDVTGLVVKTIKVIFVSGVIILEGKSDKSALGRLSGASVSAEQQSEDRKTSSSHSTRMAADGSFRFGGLYPGVVTFRIDGRGIELVRVERDGVVYPAGIPVREREQITGIRLIVQSGDASIRGVLKLPDDAPLPANARFYVSLKRIGEPVAQFDERGSNRSAEVDARGQFVAEGLLPGTYEVMAQSYPPNGVQGQILSGKQQVTVSDGVVTNIVVTLQPLSFPSRPWPRN